MKMESVRSLIVISMLLGFTQVIFSKVLKHDHNLVEPLQLKHLVRSFISRTDITMKFLRKDKHLKHICVGKHEKNQNLKDHELLRLQLHLLKRLVEFSQYYQSDFSKTRVKRLIISDISLGYQILKDMDEYAGKGKLEEIKLFKYPCQKKAGKKRHGGGALKSGDTLSSSVHRTYKALQKSLQQIAYALPN